MHAEIRVGKQFFSGRKTKENSCIIPSKICKNKQSTCKKRHKISWTLRYIREFPRKWPSPISVLLHECYFLDTGGSRHTGNGAGGAEGGGERLAVEVPHRLDQRLERCVVVHRGREAGGRGPVGDPKDGSLKPISHSFASAKSCISSERSSRNGKPCSA